MDFLPGLTVCVHEIIDKMIITEAILVFIDPGLNFTLGRHSLLLIKIYKPNIYQVSGQSEYLNHWL